MEVADDALDQGIGGSDNYVEVIPDWAVIGNVGVSDDNPETMMPVGAITEE